MSTPPPPPPRTRLKSFLATLVALGTFFARAAAMLGAGAGHLLGVDNLLGNNDRNSASRPTVVSSATPDAKIRIPTGATVISRCITVEGTGHAAPGHHLWVGIEASPGQDYLDKRVTVLDEDHWQVTGVVVGSKNATGETRTILVLDVDDPTDKWLRTISVQSKPQWYAQIIGRGFPSGITTVAHREVQRDDTSSDDGPDCSIPPA